MNNQINQMSQSGGSIDKLYRPISESIHRLDQHTAPSSINLIDINYSDTDRLLIDRIDVKKHETFDFFGWVDPSNTMHGIKEFINNIGDNHTISDSLIRLIGWITRSVIIGAGKKNHIWLTIRSIIPNHNYDEQRWHIDGRFYNSDDTNELFQYKFITVMKGAGTYLLDLKDNERKVFIDKLHSKQYRDDYKQNRTDLHIMYKDYPRLELTNDQGIVLIVGGDGSYSTIHSEPPQNQPRLFLSILTGTESEIKQWYKKTHAKNPIIWHSQYKSIDSMNSSDTLSDSSEYIGF